MGYFWNPDRYKVRGHVEDMDYTCEVTGTVFGYVHPIYPINGPSAFECYVRVGGPRGDFVCMHKVYGEREAMLHVEALVALEGL